MSDILSLPPVPTGFLLDLLFNPEDGSDMFLRNTWRYNSEDCTFRKKVCFPRECKHSTEFE
jgi:hypothetical protein